MPKSSPAPKKGAEFRGPPNPHLQLDQRLVRQREHVGHRVQDRLQGRELRMNGGYGNVLIKVKVTVKVKVGYGKITTVGDAID